MNDEHDAHVDELLADLDRALSVEPSSSVAAQARARFEDAPARTFGLRWGLAAAGVVAIAFAGYLAWPRPAQTPAASATLVSNAVVEPKAVPAVQEPAPRPSMRAAPSRRPAPTHVAVATTTVVDDQRVLISPRQRIALGQLWAAVRDGRVDSERFTAPLTLPAAPEFDPILLDIVLVGSPAETESGTGGGTRLTSGESVVAVE